MHRFFSHKIVLRIRSFVRTRKVVSSLILLVLVGGGYYAISAFSGTDLDTRYVIGKVTRGTIVSSITGSGQISASSQVDLKTKAAGDVLYVGVKSGQEVRAGSLLLQLDARDAQKSVRDAEANLESAKISHQKLLKPADTLSLIQAENALSQANASLAKGYDDGFNSVSNAFLDLPTVLIGLSDIISGTKVGQSGQDNLSAYADLISTFDSTSVLLRDSAREAFQKARAAYDRTFILYRSTSRLSDKATIETLINEVYDSTKTIAEAVKRTNDFLSVVKDRLSEHNQALPAPLSGHLSSLSTYIGNTNSHLLSLLGIKDTITSSKYSISERTESLAKLKAGAEALDISASELTLKQRENALQDAREKLADYFIRAPFDGTVASLSVKKADSLGSGASVGVFITKQQLAEISLNEVDVARIKIGQPALLTFDAVSNLKINGTVLEMDTVGTVSQGVVTYNVKIGFNSPDGVIKPGMSVTAEIITDSKPDVLIVPQGAVKTQGRTKYVEVVTDTLLEVENGTRVTQTGIVLASAPERKSVEVGMSNDTVTEILSGLEEGERIVIRTISSGVAATQTAPTIFGASGAGRNTGGGGVNATFRVQR
ncbi:MAG: Efflux transporter, RND family, MFP subunit [Parcubacteria group bacterium GW2011_GWA2_49_9]|nr:MAG: Efflux transporter, RND family, MFP subunit [Parcubacteria group bacterium GW2011_GWA2_49_9]